MTWKEFKDKVESIGVSEDTEIRRIEVGCITDVNIHEDFTDGISVY